MQLTDIKIIECFNLTGMGLLTELQHLQNGIPPNTVISNPQNGESWTIKKRIHSGTLMISNSEIYFDCETEFDHVSHRYINEEARKEAIEKELKRRQDKIYWYLLVANKKNKNIKPEVGSLLEIESH